MSKYKTMDVVRMFIRVPDESCATRIKPHNDIPVYHAWPKLLHHDHEQAKRWSSSKMRGSNNARGVSLDVDNEFEALVYDDIGHRGHSMSSKIPQALIHLKNGVDNKPCYLMVDLRVDGFIEASLDFGIKNGKFTTPMAFRFSSSNYYLVPKKGKTYKEANDKIQQLNVGKKKETTQVEIGVPFIGNYESVYVYLGSRKCKETPVDDHSNVGSYDGSKVHVYQQLIGLRGDVMAGYSTTPRVYLSVSKSKMKVKRLVDLKDEEALKYFNDTMELLSEDEVTSAKWIKGTYGSTMGRYLKLTKDELLVGQSATPRRRCWFK